MADNFADFYSGNMAPPLRLPNGSYAPAPSTPSPMSVEDIYRGIYGGSSAPSLSSVSRPTVPINPNTGMPYAPTVNASAQYAGGIGAGASGSVDYRKKVTIPSPSFGPTPVPKYQDRLPATPAGMPLAGTYASAQGGLGPAGRVSGSLTASMPKAPASSDVVNISFEPMSEVSGMNIANSTGKPVRTPSGRVYQPTNAATDRVRAPMQQVSNQPAQQQRQPGLMGLFSGLFGGGQQGGGGLFGGSGPGLFSGGQITRAPLAGNPILVDPSTQAGSTLESMGFSSGAVLPSAVSDNLSKRGYI